MLQEDYQVLPDSVKDLVEYARVPITCISFDNGKLTLTTPIRKITKTFSTFTDETSEEARKWWSHNY